MNEKMQRRVRREANRLLAKRRYRERKQGQPAATVWSIRVGPAAPKPPKRKVALTGQGRRAQKRAK